MEICVVYGNIALAKTDAVVNAANAELQAGSGVCGAIFDAAGERELQKACDAIGHCDIGSAVITPGFGLAAKYIIHAVGPRYWIDENPGERLASAYVASLRLAKQYGCRSVAFPSISTGVYRFPLKEAAAIAVKAIREFDRTENKACIMECRICCIDPETYEAFSEELRKQD